MKTDAILDILVNDAFPVYSSSVATYADKQIFKEILKSLPKEQLMDVNELLEHECGVPWEQKEYTEWLLNRDKREDPKPQKNEPITTLIKWFADKKSGKVTYAFYHLKKRYPHQSFKIQKQILKVFLSRTASSAGWAASTLSENWIPSLAQDLQSSWERRDTRYSHGGLAWAVLEHLPREYAISQQEALAKDIGYGKVCSVLGNEPSFHIDEDRLDVPSWFYVMSQLRKTVSIHIMWEKVREYFDELDCDDPMQAAAKNPALGYMIEVSQFILPALRQMGATEILVQLAKMQNAAALEAAKVNEASRMRVFKKAMKERVLNDSFPLKQDNVSILPM